MLVGVDIQYKYFQTKLNHYSIIFWLKYFIQIIAKDICDYQYWLLMQMNYDRSTEVERSITVVKRLILKTAISRYQYLVLI